MTDIEDIENNLAVFIRLFFEKFTVGGRSINWASHTRSFDLSSSDIHLIKYENLLTDAEKELQKTLNFLEMTPDHSIAKVVEKYSFQNMTEREPGQEDKSSFLRKGIAGDWKNHFTDESLEVFYSYAREQMERLGYL